MFTIKGKQQFGAVYENGKCIAIFNRGAATTNDPVIADIMRAKGYTVEGEAPVIDPLAKMTKDELKAYAAEHDVDLTDVPDKKPDILTAIRAAEQ